MSSGTNSQQPNDDFGMSLPVDDLDVVAPTDEDLAEEEANGVEVEDDLEKDLPTTTDEGFESLEALRDKEEEEAEEEYNHTLQDVE